MNKLKIFIMTNWFFVTLMVVIQPICSYAQIEQNSDDSFVYSVDPFWPKQLPNNWLLGEVSGVSVDFNDNIWILQRPESLTTDELGAEAKPPISECCKAAPPVIEFDAHGNVIQAWGGSGNGYDWPSELHSIYVDKEGFVWISGSGLNDGQLLKFTSNGKFVLQIGKKGPQTNSDDVTRLGQPAGITVDEVSNEVYVADGYYNHRVIVFNATTGAYKRHWGAYGKRKLIDYPEDKLQIGQRIYNKLPPLKSQLLQFGNPVHCIRISKEGLVYVCDRLNDRIQVFHKDGHFVKEFFISPRTAGYGSVWDLAFSTDLKQQFIYIIDGTNNHLYTLNRKTGAIIATQGHSGRYAGQFHWSHDIAVDSKGNLYVGEVDSGKRIQKFIPSNKIKKN